MCHVEIGLERSWDGIEFTSAAHNWMCDAFGQRVVADIPYIIFFFYEYNLTQPCMPPCSPKNTKCIIVILQIPGRTDNTGLFLTETMFGDSLWWYIIMAVVPCRFKGRVRANVILWDSTTVHGDYKKHYPSNNSTDITSRSAEHGGCDWGSGLMVAVLCCV